MESVKMLKEKDMVKAMEINLNVLPFQYILYIKAKFYVTPFLQQSKTEYKEISNITFTDVWRPAFFFFVQKFIMQCLIIVCCRLSTASSLLEPQRP